MFRTIQRTPDNVKVIVPNSAVIGSTIKNFSAANPRRIDLVTAVVYEENIGMVRDTLMSIMKSHPLVLSDPAPTVDVLELADTKVTLAVRPWARTEDYGRVCADVREQIKSGFRKSASVCPTPSKSSISIRLLEDRPSVKVAGHDRGEVSAT